MNILEKIVCTKQEEIAEAKIQQPLKQLESQLDNKPRGFIKALQKQVSLKLPAVIAEIKKASPSKGVIREEFNVSAIAKAYTQGGATCLSVLTDRQYFQGANEYLITARKNSHLPILRKDFIIDPYQVFEAKAMGADCILLIKAILSQKQLQTLLQLAKELQLDVLLEIHDKEELNAVLELDFQLLGINNRNLKSFTTHLATTFDLLPFIPQDKFVVTESGIHSAKDVEAMLAAKVNCFLVGESMMRSEDPGAALRKLFNLG